MTLGTLMCLGWRPVVGMSDRMQTPAGTFLMVPQQLMGPDRSIRVHAVARESSNGVSHRFCMAAFATVTMGIASEALTYTVLSERYDVVDAYYARNAALPDALVSFDGVFGAVCFTLPVVALLAHKVWKHVRVCCGHGVFPLPTHQSALLELCVTELVCTGYFVWLLFDLAKRIGDLDRLKATLPDGTSRQCFVTQTSRHLYLQMLRYVMVPFMFAHDALLDMTHLVTNLLRYRDLRYCSACTVAQRTSETLVL